MAGQTKNIWIIVAVLVLAAIALAWFFSSGALPPVTNTETAATTTTETKTTTTSTSGTTKPSGTSSGSHSVTPPVTSTVITYTSKGFSPAYLEIKAGKAITFINKSSGTMRVVSTLAPLNQGYPNPGFDEENAVGLNGTFTLNLSIPGEWHYKNLLKSDQTGVIVVTPQ